MAGHSPNASAGARVVNKLAVNDKNHPKHEHEKRAGIVAAKRSTQVGTEAYQPVRQPRQQNGRHKLERRLTNQRGSHKVAVERLHLAVSPVFTRQDFEILRKLSVQKFWRGTYRNSPKTSDHRISAVKM
eukprot:SAG31_NODE_5560_length_2457_cov_59.927905_3_plen_129_part_00